MPKPSPRLTVVTGDIVKSREYLKQDRARLQKHLLGSWKKTEKHFPDSFVSDFSFRITAGDEFQFVCKSIEVALESLTLLRIYARLSELDPPVTLRACLATGTRIVKGKADPYTQDGSAFSLAREGLEKLNKLSKQLTLIQYDRKSELVILANGFLPLMDNIYRGWTRSQSAVLAELFTTGNTLEAVSDKLKITKQTAFKHKQRSSWDEFNSALLSMVFLLQEKNISRFQLTSPK